VARIASGGIGNHDADRYLELLDVAKHFGGVQALDHVSLTVARGSVHALVGENGAGKSTLGRIVAGAVAPDAGRILLDGEPVSFRSPREALEQKVAAIAQEPSVVPQLTVAENVLLGVEPRSGGFVRRRKLEDEYRALASEAGFELAGGMSAGRLRTAEQQKVEILRALSRDAQLIVMDEPSAALSSHETHQLHEIVRSLVQAGKTILLISHLLHEVLDLADMVTVLRDGRVVRTSPTEAETESSLVEAMLGRSLTSTFPPKEQPAADAPLLLSVRELSAPGVTSATFDLRAGEILGIAGLVGAGRTELARALYGAAKVESGTVTLATGERFGRSPGHSLSAGLAMIPESRKDEGLIFARSAIENATLSRLRTLSVLGIVRRARERKAARGVLEQCDVRGAAYTAPVRTLSGGNQQKVLLARTLLCGPRVMIADEPTRGVDVGAKRAIYDFLTGLAAEGLGVILISSELEEILGLAHRTLVMRGGRIVAEFAADTMTEGAILGAAFADESAGRQSE
jgi:simple sugar transport system ATP-binding protein/ribose transport system ATP-binding protein